ncbi:MAG: hypothetical protein EOO50_12755 [Flavobacterium sp.]|uniref:hypothetical protein n=1 Tax=Flavobacterium sp. TaxID=239 RepID=UPI0011F925B4|nr:hypothetical protein [Flavobacterium sp.]RZJ65674.1 MAG: hypothetical protein EOO50_12755 [Flavobacterium sp.]
MGLGDFFRKLFGGTPENVNEPPPIEQSPDPIKDASDHVLPTPEIVPETTEPVVEKTAFAQDANEDFEEPRQSPDENRFEEPAD